MVRKTIFSILFLFNAVFIFGNDISISIKAGANSYSYDELNKVKIPIKNGTIYKIEDFGMDKCIEVSYEIFGDERDWYYSYFSKRMPILYTTDLKSICLDNIIPEETESTFPDSYISLGTYDAKKVYINSESIDAFYNKNKELIKRAGVNSYFNNDAYALVGEYLKGNMESYPILSNVVITFFTLENLLIKNIHQIDNYNYEVDCYFGGDRDISFEQDYECLSVWLFTDHYYLQNVSKGTNIKLKITFDGDYVKFYDINEKKLLVTHVLVDKEFALKCADFFQDKIVDYSNITWPRHADGTCDYEANGKSSSAKTVSTSTNVAVKKTMTTNCNLKLRSGEATSTQVLTVMSAGTKVKILELGKAETIDGINSNWVKVEVQSGAKDRDGKAIKAGLTGWCYGGYLE